jgi:hypothetical protein
VANWRDLTGWTQGKVTLFNAFGIAGATYPQLTASTTADIAAAQDAATSGAGGNTGSSAITNVPGTNVTAPTSSGPCNSTTTTANQTLGQQLTASAGWTGQQWSDFNQIVMLESGWCNTIQNPTSTAYGIGQFLNTTWATVGGTKTSDAKTQIQYMIAYIKNVYKTPSAALQFHLANGYY